MIECHRGSTAPESLPEEPAPPEQEASVEALGAEIDRMGRLSTRTIERLQDAPTRDPSLWERVKFHVGDTVMLLYEVGATATGITAAATLGRAAQRHPGYLVPAVSFGLAFTIAALSMEKIRQARARKHPGRL